MVGEDLLNIILAGDLDEPAGLENIRPVEFTNDAKVVEWCFKVASDLLDDGRT